MTGNDAKQSGQVGYLGWHRIARVIGNGELEGLSKWMGCPLKELLRGSNVGSIHKIATLDKPKWEALRRRPTA